MPLGSFSGAGLSMGVSFTLVDDFSPVADKIQARMTQLSNAVAGLTSGANSAAAGITQGLQQGSKAVTAAVTSTHDLLAAQYVNMQMANQLWGTAKGMLGGFVDAAKIDASFQRYELGIQTFVGSAQKAHDLVKAITEDAIANPRFEVAGMLKANQRLIAMGEDADKTKSLITNLTSILAGTGGGNAELNRASIALEKVASSGTLSARHMLSFSSSLIPMRALIEDAFGKPFDELFKAGITLDMISKALEHAVSPAGKFKDALELAGKSVEGMTARLTENLSVMKASIGQAFRPVTEFLLRLGNALTDAMRTFAASPLGMWVVRLSLAFTIFFAILAGGYVIMMTTRLAVIGMAYAFNATTKAAILTAYTTKGLTASIRVLGGAIWTALWPLLLIAAAIGAIIGIFYLLNRAINSNIRWVQALGVAILVLLGPIGWLVGGIMIARRALREFDAVMNGASVQNSGFIGFLQRVGGILRFIGALLTSYNSATKEFTVSKKLVDAMQKLGILELAQKIATWTARVLEFWQGLKIGVKEVLKSVASTITGIMNAFLGPEEQLGNWNDLISYSKTNLETWKKMGIAVGKVLVYSILAIAGAMVTLSVAVFLALIPMTVLFLGLVVVIGSVIYVLYIMYKLMQSGKDAGIAFANAIKTAFEDMFSPLNSGIEKITTLLRLFGLLNGQGPAFFGGSKGVAPQLNPNGMVAPWLNNTPALQPAVPGRSTAFNAMMEDNTAVSGNRGRSSSTTTTNNNTTAANITIPVMLDGYKLTEIILDRIDLERHISNA